MNFARDHLEKQFARELRMKQISKASDVERGAAAPRPKAWAKKESTRQALPKQPTTKPPKPQPKDLFDAAATLKILVGTSYDYAAERAEQLQLPAFAPAQPASSAIEALAALDVARNKLTAKRDQDNALPDDEKMPDTVAELEQELAWLKRKVAASREEAKQEEAALRERFKQRGKKIESSDYLADERVMAARRRNNRYSRRQVVLMRLKKPGSKLGPSIPDADGPTGGAGEEGAASSSDANAPAAPTSDRGAPTPASALTFLGGTSSLTTAAHSHANSQQHQQSPPRSPGSPGSPGSPQQPQKVIARPGGIMSINGTISMYQRAAERYRAEQSAKEAAAAAEAAVEQALAEGRRARKHRGGGSPKRAAMRRTVTQRDVKLRKQQQQQQSGEAPQLRADGRYSSGEAPARIADAPAGSASTSTLADEAGAPMSLAVPGRAVLAITRMANFTDDLDSDGDGALKWATSFGNVKQVLELRSVRDAVRLMRELHGQALSHAQDLLSPRPPLGVRADVPTLAQLRHAFELERPERIAEVLELCREDARRRFVLGRERYEGEVKAQSLALLAKLEDEEAAHLDGRVEEAFLTQHSIAKLTSAALLAEYDLPPLAERRADAVVSAFQQLGYAAADVGELLLALATHEPTHLQRAFAILDMDGVGYFERSEVARTLAPVALALAPRDRSDSFRKQVSGLRSLGGLMAYNEFAALLREADLLGDDEDEDHDSREGSLHRGGSFRRGSSFSRGGSFHQKGRLSFKNASYKKESDAAEQRMERKLARLVPRRKRRSYEKLKENMLQSGYTPKDMRAVCHAMFVSQEEEFLVPAWRVFDPMGRGTLSLREVQAAFSLFGDAVEVRSDTRGHARPPSKPLSRADEYSAFDASMRSLPPSRLLSSLDSHAPLASSLTSAFLCTLFCLFRILTARGRHSRV